MEVLEFVKILSESSVADKIKRESAVEIIAAIAPVINIPAIAGGKIFSKTIGITNSWSFRPSGPKIAIPIHPKAIAPTYAIKVHKIPTFRAYLACFWSFIDINLVVSWG